MLMLVLEVRSHRHFQLKEDTFSLISFITFILKSRYFKDNNTNLNSIFPL